MYIRNSYNNPKTFIFLLISKSVDVNTSSTQYESTGAHSFVDGCLYGGVPVVHLWPRVSLQQELLPKQTTQLVGGGGGGVHCECSTCAHVQSQCECMYNYT